MHLVNFKINYDKLLQLALMLLSAALIIYHLTVIAFPYPLEFREGGSIQTTNALLKGENSYKIENQPRDTNVYGILYSGACYPFAKLLGSTLQLHRAVSGIFILLSCTMLFLFARLRKHPVVPALTISLILYSSLLYFVTPLARPDSLGLFLFLVALYIPYRYRYSSLSLLASSFIGISAFFTKTFFLLIFLFLGSYLFLFVSKKKGIAFSFISCIGLLISALLLNHICETYIADVFYNNMNAATFDYTHLFRQLYFGAKSYAFVSTIFVFGTLAAVLNKRKQEVSITHFNSPVAPSNFVDVRDFNRPLFMFDVNCTSYYLWCAAMVFCLTLGGHRGAWMTYFYQLVAPFFLLVLLDVAPHIHVSRSYLYLTLAGMLNLAVFYTTTLPHYNELQVQPQWEQIFELLSRNDNVFNSPAVAPVLQEKNKIIYDSGMSEYFRLSLLPKAFSILSPFYTLDKKVLSRMEQYSTGINDAVKKERFDLIMITQNYPHYSLVDKKLLTQYYIKENTISAPMPHTGQNWMLEIWTRK